MLLCNLPTLLSERNLNISKVSKDTSISRTTLTSLYSNSSKGIQFDTLNKLCLYLGISHEKFFIYMPYDIVIFCSDIKTVSGDILSGDPKGKGIAVISFEIRLKIDNKEYHLPVNARCTAQTDDKKVFGDFSLELEFDISDNELNEKKYEHEKVIQLLSEIPIPFLKEIENQIIKTFLSANFNLILYRTPDSNPAKIEEYFNDRSQINVTWPQGISLR